MEIIKHGKHVKHYDHVDTGLIQQGSLNGCGVQNYFLHQSLLL